ncbi:hypothetical protein SLE2022_196770 [Rubroshorea leprosula]
MASTCNTGCINDARVLVRRNYKWPESDAAFIRSVSSNNDLRLHKRRSGPTPTEQRQPWRRGRNGYPQCPVVVVDSISCRQMYLRSYPFSRKESVHEKTKKCFGRLKERLRRRKCGAVRRAKEVSCATVVSILRRLLSCTAECKDP